MKESTTAGYLTAERKSFHDITDRLMQGAASLTKKDPMLFSCVNSSLNLNMNILYFKNYLVESYGQITEHF
jgi:hypothetical protein